MSDWEDAEDGVILLGIEGPVDTLTEHINVVRFKELSDRTIFQGLDSNKLPVELTIRAMGLDEGVR